MELMIVDLKLLCFRRSLETPTLNLNKYLVKRMKDNQMEKKGMVDGKGLKLNEKIDETQNELMGDAEEIEQNKIYIKDEI